MINKIANVLVVGVQVLGSILIVGGLFINPVFTIWGMMIAAMGLLLESNMQKSDMLAEQQLTNALLVEMLVEMNPEMEEDCGGDCENCICDKFN